MRSSSLAVIVPALTLLFAPQAPAESQLRFAGTAVGKPPASTRRSESPVRPVAHVMTEEPVPAVAEDGASEGYAAGPYAPAEAGPMSPGCAYGESGAFAGYNWYGYNPDFGSLSGGMSVWPGVPACCDAWFGYCSEPRCNHCNCHKGRYLYYHCPKGSCQPELLIWEKGCKEKCCSGCGKCGAGCGTCGGGCRPVAMCYGTKAAGKSGALVRQVSIAGKTQKAEGDSCCGAEAGGAAQPTPAIENPPRNELPNTRTAPPRNELPTARAGTSRR